METVFHPSLLGLRRLPLCVARQRDDDVRARRLRSSPSAPLSFVRCGARGRAGSGWSGLGGVTDPRFASYLIGVTKRETGFHRNGTTGFQPGGTPLGRPPEPLSRPGNDGARAPSV